MTGVTIAGGGLAGAAAAIRLARAGRQVTLLERSLGPAHKVCGEFLSHEAQSDLADLGLDLAGLGAHPITHLRVVRAHRAVRLRLPFRALGVSRFRLDEALLARAASEGADIRRGEMFRPGCGGAGTVFLATGKHETQGMRRDRLGDAGELVGFKTYFRLQPEQRQAVSGHVELILFRDGYAGLQLVEDGVANLCLLVHRARLERTDTWSALLASLRQESGHLDMRLGGAAEQLERPLAISRTPFGFVHRPASAERVFRLGDQAAVIPAFAGDGMSIALHSAALATGVHLEGGGAADYHRRLRRDVAGQVGRATALYRAGRHPLGQHAVMTLARAAPGAIRFMISLTRVMG